MISMVQDMAGGQANASFGKNVSPPKSKVKLNNKTPSLDASYYTQPQTSEIAAPKPVDTSEMSDNPYYTSEMSNNPLLNRASNYNQSNAGTFKSNSFGVPDLPGFEESSIPGLLFPTNRNAGGSIGKGIDALVKNPGEAADDFFAAALGGTVKQLGEDIGISQTGPTPTGTPKKTPEEVAAIDAQTEQQRASADYKKKMPYYQSRLSEDLAKESNKQMNKAQKEVDERNTARGLGYGGLNQGMQEKVRSLTQQQLAGQTQEMNQGLLDLGEQIDTGTIKTGLGYQQDLQRRQDQIYQQALARQQAQNSMTGSGLGLLASYALMAAL